MNNNIRCLTSRLIRKNVLAEAERLKAKQEAEAESRKEAESAFIGWKKKKAELMKEAEEKRRIGKQG